MLDTSIVQDVLGLVQLPSGFRTVVEVPIFVVHSVERDLPRLH